MWEKNPIAITLFFRLLTCTCTCRSSTFEHIIPGDTHWAISTTANQGTRRIPNRLNDKMFKYIKIFITSFKKYKKIRCLYCAKSVEYSVYYYKV